MIPVGVWLVDATVGGRRFQVVRIVDAATIEIMDEGVRRPRLVNRMLLETQLRRGEVLQEKEG